MVFGLSGCLVSRLSGLEFWRIIMNYALLNMDYEIG